MTRRGRATLGPVFGIDAVDLVIILVLGVVLFGPERLPEYSRKAARVFVYLRDIANNAKSTIRTELGPEYSDLELRDLHPKAFITKHMREEVEAIDEARRELEGVKRTATGAVKDAEKSAEAATGAVKEPAGALPTRTPDSPFDPDAT